MFTNNQRHVVTTTSTCNNVPNLRQNMWTDPEELLPLNPVHQDSCLAPGVLETIPKKGPISYWAMSIMFAVSLFNCICWVFLCFVCFRCQLAERDEPPSGGQSVEFYQEGTIDYEMSLDLDDISVTVSILKECKVSVQCVTYVRGE